MNLKELHNTFSKNVYFYITNILKKVSPTKEKLAKLSGSIAEKLNINTINNIANTHDIPFYKTLIKRK